MSINSLVRHAFCYSMGITFLLLFMLCAQASNEINGAKVLQGVAIEGGLIIALTKPGNKVIMDGDAIPTESNGLFVLGFHRDSDSPIEIRILQSKNENLVTILKPKQRQYKIQRIDGLKKDMVTPPKTVINKIKTDRAAVAAARQKTASTGDFWKGLDWPVKGSISGVYGSQRVLNGQPRQPHYGIDIAAPKGTPVKAPASGLVTLIENLYFSGWTIIINHGLGLNSTFLHLDSVSTYLGKTVSRGEVIGTVGSTGRSTGPHLDWRLDWLGRRIDASLVAGPMPETG